jgi:hypothetical protein
VATWAPSRSGAVARGAISIAAAHAFEAQDWRAYDGMAFGHFDQLKMMLDRRDSSYRA